MSEKQQSPNKVVVSSTGGTGKRLFGILTTVFWSGKRGKITSSVVIVLVAGIIVGTLVWHNHQQANSKTQDMLADVKAFANSQLQKELKVGQQAQAMSNNGQYAAAQQLLDSNIANTTDKAKQADLYVDKSSIALANKKYDDALTFAQKSEELHPTFYSASMIARAAEAKGDKALALRYYQLELKRIGTPHDDYTIPHLEAKIKSLGGKV